MVTRENAPREILEFLWAHSNLPWNHTTTKQDWTNVTRHHISYIGKNQQRRSNDYDTSINRLAEAIAGFKSQQRPTTSAIFKPASTNSLLFDEKNEKFELFGHLFHTMLKMLPDMTEVREINHFYAHFRTKAIQQIASILHPTKEVLKTYSKKFDRNTLHSNQEQLLNIFGTSSLWCNYKNIFRHSSGIQWVCGASICWSGPTEDRQFPIRQNATAPEKVK